MHKLSSFCLIPQGNSLCSYHGRVLLFNINSQNVVHLKMNLLQCTHLVRDLGWKGLLLGLCVYMCFVVTCWERADLLALVCGVIVSVTYPLVS